MMDKAKKRIKELQDHIEIAIGSGLFTGTQVHFAESIVQSLEYAVALEEKFDRFARDTMRRRMTAGVRVERIEEKFEDLEGQMSSLLGEKLGPVDFIKGDLARLAVKVAAIRERTEALEVTRATGTTFNAEDLPRVQEVRELVVAAREVYARSRLYPVDLERFAEALEPFEGWAR